MRRYLAPVLIFFGLFGCYAAMSPGSIAGMGYTGEEIKSGKRMLDILGAWMSGSPAPPMEWSRHGPVPLLVDLPFLALGSKWVSADFCLSLQPIVLTALLISLLFCWLRQVTSATMALLLTFGAAFATMLWPYAFIGLETKQSLFLFAAAWLALAMGTPQSWPSVLLFGVCSGLAVSVKSTSFVLFPAVLYLVWLRFKDVWRERRAQIATVLAIIGGAWIAAAAGRRPFWGASGGASNAIQPWLIDQPFAWVANVFGLFGSPNKGLLLFAPVLLLSLYSLPRLFRTHHGLSVFTCLMLGGLISFLAMLRGFADECWGPRYLHTAVAPLIVCLGAARPAFRLRRDVLLVALVLLGVAISFLGAFYYYGVLHLVATTTGHNTLESLMGDSMWNHIGFNLRLFRVWMSEAKEPVLWSPDYRWMFAPPPNAPPPAVIDLRGWSEPQSLLLRKWDVPLTGVERDVVRFFRVCFFVGPALLALAVYFSLRKTVEITRAPATGATPPVAVAAAVPAKTKKRATSAKR